MRELGRRGTLAQPRQEPKQGGGKLGISEITVKTHRGRVMRKMKAGSLAELVKMVAKLHLTPEAPRDLLTP